MTSALVFCAAVVMSGVLVAVIRAYALRSNMLDVPSARSSHQRPVPRGAGAGVIATILALVAWSPWRTGAMTAALSTALAGVALVAVIGWLDDRRSLTAVPRLVVHVMAGVTVAWAVRGAPGPLGAAGVAAVAWWVFWTVAMINVTNFMDGIDGLIGSQMAIFGAHLSLASPTGSVSGVLGLALAGASVGFLAWNWSPARIFLGDVGSGALGAVATLGGALAVAAGAGPVEVVFLPLLPLFLDASVTLARRARRGEALWEAHRSHLYQRLANSGWGHARTAMVFALAAGAGVVVSQAGTSYRALACSLYALAVLGVGAWLDSRVEGRSRREGQDRPSP